MTEEMQEHVTVLAEEFSAAALEFHRREMGKKGYTLDGPIVRHRVYFVSEPGEPKNPLGEGRDYYVASFRRKAAA